MRGWKYALVALADAEANFLVVKGKQSIEDIFPKWNYVENTKKHIF